MTATEDALVNLMHWLLTERSWEYFRAEFLCPNDKEAETCHEKNAKAITAKLHELRDSDPAAARLFKIAEARCKAF